MQAREFSLVGFSRQRVIAAATVLVLLHLTFCRNHAFASSSFLQHSALAGAFEPGPGETAGRSITFAAVSGYDRGCEARRSRESRPLKPREREFVRAPGGPALQKFSTPHPGGRTSKAGSLGSAPRWWRSQGSPSTRRPQENLRPSLAPFVWPNDGENLVAGDFPLDHDALARDAKTSNPVFLHKPASHGRVSRPGNTEARIV